MAKELKHLQDGGLSPPDDTAEKHPHQVSVKTHIEQTESSVIIDQIISTTPTSQTNNQQRANACDKPNEAKAIPKAKETSHWQDAINKEGLISLLLRGFETCVRVAMVLLPLLIPAC